MNIYHINNRHFALRYDGFVRVIRMRKSAHRFIITTIVALCVLTKIAVGADRDDSTRNEIEYYKSEEIDDIRISIDRFIVTVEDIKANKPNAIAMLSKSLDEHNLDRNSGSAMPAIMKMISNGVLLDLSDEQKELVSNKLILYADYKIDNKTIPPGITYSCSYLFPVLPALIELRVSNSIIIDRINTITSIDDKFTYVKALSWLLAKQNGVLRTIELINAEDGNKLSIRQDSVKDYVVGILKSALNTSTEAMLCGK